MSVIPCERNAALQKLIRDYADALKEGGHVVGSHGLNEHDFYQGGVFRGAIERIRGQFSAAMADKRDFVSRVLGFMQDRGFIRDWDSAGAANRYDYGVTMPDGRFAAIELKGCLDGNNTNIFERPPQAREFVIWSICQNAGADPRHNVWSGIHTRLSAQIVDNGQVVDGLVVWDWICGTIGRPCPKLAPASGHPERDPRLTDVGPYKLTPPCIYLFPPTVPTVRNNPAPTPNRLADVSFLNALHVCFGGMDAEVHSVSFEVANEGIDIVRKTAIRRGGVLQRESDWTAIRRR